MQGLYFKVKKIYPRDHKCQVLSVVHFMFFWWLAYVMFCFVSIQFNMDRVNVEEFYEVYKGVVSEYNVSIKVNVKQWY